MYGKLLECQSFQLEQKDELLLLNEYHSLCNSHSREDPLVFSAFQKLLHLMLCNDFFRSDATGSHGNKTAILHEICSLTEKHGVASVTFAVDLIMKRQMAMKAYNHSNWKVVVLLSNYIVTRCCLTNSSTDIDGQQSSSPNHNPPCTVQSSYPCLADALIMLTEAYHHLDRSDDAMKSARCAVELVQSNIASASQLQSAAVDSNQHPQSPESSTNHSDIVTGQGWDAGPCLPPQALLVCSYFNLGSLLDKIGLLKFGIGWYKRAYIVAHQNHMSHHLLVLLKDAYSLAESFMKLKSGDGSMELSRSSLPNSSVTPGTYQNDSFTPNSQGAFSLTPPVPGSSNNGFNTKPITNANGGVNVNTNGTNGRQFSRSFEEEKPRMNPNHLLQLGRSKTTLDESNNSSQRMIDIHVNTSAGNEVSYYSVNNSQLMKASPTSGANASVPGARTSHSNSQHSKYKQNDRQQEPRMVSVMTAKTLSGLTDSVCDIQQDDSDVNIELDNSTDDIPVAKRTHEVQFIDNHQQRHSESPLQDDYQVQIYHHKPTGNKQSVLKNHKAQNRSTNGSSNGHSHRSKQKEVMTPVPTPATTRNLSFSSNINYNYSSDPQDTHASLYPRSNPTPNPPRKVPAYISKSTTAVATNKTKYRKITKESVENSNDYYQAAYQVMHYAATLIGAVGRGYVTRKYIAAVNKQRLFMRKLRRQRVAMRTIQSAVRMFLAKLRVRKLLLLRSSLLALTSQNSINVSLLCGEATSSSTNHITGEIASDSVAIVPMAVKPKVNRSVAGCPVITNGNVTSMITFIQNERANIIEKKRQLLEWNAMEKEKLLLVLQKLQEIPQRDSTTPVEAEKHSNAGSRSSSRSISPRPSHSLRNFSPFSSSSSPALMKHNSVGMLTPKRMGSAVGSSMSSNPLNSTAGTSDAMDTTTSKFNKSNSVSNLFSPVRTNSTTMNTEAMRNEKSNAVYREMVKTVVEISSEPVNARYKKGQKVEAKYLGCYFKRHNVTWHTARVLHVHDRQHTVDSNHHYYYDLIFTNGEMELKVADEYIRLPLTCFTTVQNAAALSKKVREPVTSSRLVTGKRSQNESAMHKFAMQLQSQSIGRRNKRMDERLACRIHNAILFQKLFRGYLIRKYFPHFRKYITKEKLKYFLDTKSKRRSKSIVHAPGSNLLMSFTMFRKKHYFRMKRNVQETTTVVKSGISREHNVLDEKLQIENRLLNTDINEYYEALLNGQAELQKLRNQIYHLTHSTANVIKNNNETAEKIGQTTLQAHEASKLSLQRAHELSVQESQLFNKLEPSFIHKVSDTSNLLDITTGMEDDLLDTTMSPFPYPPSQSYLALGTTATDVDESLCYSHQWGETSQSFAVLPELQACMDQNLDNKMEEQEHPPAVNIHAIRNIVQHYISTAMATAVDNRK